MKAPASRSGPRRWALPVGVVGFAILLTVPLFFEIYRQAAFNTAPRDDYGSYLRYLAGDGGSLPGAPFIYRIFSVAVAVPFYRLLPVYAFSGLPDPDLATLRAIEALAAVSWLALLATCAIVFLISRRRVGASLKASALVAGLSLFLASFMSQSGVDPIAVLLIACLVFLLDRPFLFALLLLVSVGFNEKVPIIFAALFGLRVLVSRDQRSMAMLAVAVAALGVYVAIRWAVGAAGNENQLSPSTYLGSIARLIPEMVSLKGAVTNLLPTVLVAVLATLAFTSGRSRPITSSLWRASDALVFVAILAAALAIDQPGVADAEFSIGRTVMFTYPLYLPLLANRIDRWFPDPVAERSPG